MPVSSAETVSAVGSARPPVGEQVQKRSALRVSGMEADLQALVDHALLEDRAIRSVALYVHVPARGLAWEGAAGLANPATGSPMTSAHPVRIASNTKTFVAVAILRAAEEGLLELDDPISLHLTDELLAIMRDGGYEPGRMTVRHLLTHTSGLFDHTDSARYSDAILANPTHRWTRREQLEAAMQWGEPWGAPGEVFHYSDTGYVLLGGILEHAAGRPMAEVVRSLVDFRGLGLVSTWWESLEPRPEGALEMAHPYFGEVDTAHFDPSSDLYGGGGLLSTVGELGRFFRSAAKGTVFKRAETLRTMLSTLEGVRAAGAENLAADLPGVYRMGLKVDVLKGHTVYLHSGFWGTVAAYFPGLELTVAAAVNQSQGGDVLMRLLERGLALVENDSAGESAQVGASGSDAGDGGP